MFDRRGGERRFSSKTAEYCLDGYFDAWDPGHLGDIGQREPIR